MDGEVFGFSYHSNYWLLFFTMTYGCVEIVEEALRPQKAGPDWRSGFGGD